MDSEVYWGNILNRLTPLVGALILGTMAAPACAESYIVDTGAASSHRGLILDGDSGILDWTQSWHAGLFTLHTDTIITGVEAWMTVITSGAMTTSIYSAADGLPGASAALFSTTYNLTSGGSFFDWQGISGLNWQLSAGSYWLSEEPGHDSSFSGALWMQPHDPLTHYAESIRSGWEYDPQGQDGPDQWALRITGAAVPEPATWALMIVGFGLVGAGLRSRRAAIFAG